MLLTDLAEWVFSFCFRPAMNGLCCLLSILCRKQCKKDYRDFISITNKAGMYCTSFTNSMPWNEQTHFDPHIVDFYDVYPASSCVCLLVELHINACITFKVLQISTMGSSLASESITKTYIFKPSTFHAFLVNWLFSIWQQEWGWAADSNAIQHIKTLLLHYWVHLLFDVIQWQPLYKSFKDFIL